MGTSQLAVASLGMPACLDALKHRVAKRLGRPCIRRLPRQLAAGHGFPFNAQVFWRIVPNMLTRLERRRSTSARTRR